jgi:putative RecB family exonuclease
MFQQCPRRYKFHYIDDLAKIYAKPRPYYTMGDHIHSALKDFMSVVPPEERDVTKVEDLLREKWRRYRKGFTDLDEERLWGEKALYQVRWFAESQDLSVTPIMVEDFHKTELSPNITLVGKVDRVDQADGGGLHIIDYKTGKMPGDIDHTQLYLYALILSRETMLPVDKVSYIYLGPGEVIKQLTGFWPKGSTRPLSTDTAVPVISRRYAPGVRRLSAWAWRMKSLISKENSEDTT